MAALTHFRPAGAVTVMFALAMLAGCVVQNPPTLDEIRTGRVRGGVVSDRTLQAGEIAGEVQAIDPARREIRVTTEDGLRRALVYDRPDMPVTYHGRDYSIRDLEAGDLIAFRTRPRDSDELVSVRIEEPVQARTGSVAARRLPQRADIVEGTVERVEYDTGVFEVRPRTGRTVTVSVPFNARAADIDNFRRLRRGDLVRVEGEFTNPDNLQLLSFLSRQ